MSHIRKAALICDKCGERLDIDPTVDDPFFSRTVQLESPWRSWMEVTRGHHLCPACAKAYVERKAEMDTELKRLAGIDSIEFDL